MRLFIVIHNDNNIGAIIGTFLKKAEVILSMLSFDKAYGLSAQQLRARISDRVRAERRILGQSQREFADRCVIPLRTYKRFELGKCDSLQVFIRIVMVFERVTGMELLFPPKPVSIEPRTAMAILERARNRMKM